MAFRFILQPSMAAISAIRDGLRDARTERSPYLWTIVRDPHQRIARLREGLDATARIVLLGLAMDVIYQATVFNMFYPIEALIIAIAARVCTLPAHPRACCARVARPCLSGSRSIKQRHVSTERAAGMADPHSQPDTDRFEVRVTADTHFGWLRTRLSVERTLMSWVRTAVSLIGFGFAIVQFFERLQQMPGISPAAFPKAPEYLGLALISCGVLALLVSIWQYRWTVRYLWQDLRPDRGNEIGRDQGANAIAGHRDCRPSHPHRPVRVLRRAAASSVGAEARTACQKAPAS